MKQLVAGLNLSTKKTRKYEFPEDMERVVPWTVPVQIAAPHLVTARQRNGWVCVGGARVL